MSVLPDENGGLGGDYGRFENGTMDFGEAVLLLGQKLGQEPTNGLRPLTTLVAVFGLVANAVFPADCTLVT